MNVDILGNDDDWVVVYVDDESFYCGHSIPDFIWIRLLLSGPVNRVRQWYADFEEHPASYGAARFSDIPLTTLEEVPVA